MTYTIKFKDGSEKIFESLEGADLSWANLSCANLSGFDLLGSDFSRANLSGANLLGANLSGADLSGADLSGANLRLTNLSSANLRLTNLRLTNISEADLTRADLTRADLLGSDLRLTNFTRANLTRADLSGANLSGSDLSEANLTRANLSEANLSGVKGLINPSEYIRENFETTPEGVIAYKVMGLHYTTPDHWEIIPGATLEEVCNSDRATECGSGVNVGTLEWIQKSRRDDSSVWKVLIPWTEAPSIVVPYAADGKIRCGCIKLIEVGSIKDGVFVCTSGVGFEQIIE